MNQGAERHSISDKEHLRRLALQLQILKAKLAKVLQGPPAKSFGDLYGLLKRQMESTEQEIYAVLYRLP